MLTTDNIKDIYPLSPLQEGMYFYTQKQPNTYFQQITLTTIGAMAPGAAQQALEALLDRHDALRTVFSRKAGRLLQIVLKRRNTSFHYEDISGCPDQDTWLKEYKRKDFANAFDLHKDVLIRLALFKRSHEAYTWVWSYHHIILDGWCLPVLFTDYFRLYAGLAAGQPVALPEPFPYRRYIQWQEQLDQQASLAFWKGYLEGHEKPTPVHKDLSLPAPHQGQAENGPRTASESVLLGQELSVGLGRTAAGLRVTLNVLFQAAWSVVLARYNNSTDVVFGAVHSGRPTEIEGIESLVGMCINTVPVRVLLTDSLTLAGLCQQLQEDFLRRTRHGYLQLATIQAHSTLKNNLIDHVLAFENYPVDKALAGEDDQRALPFELVKSEVEEEANYDFGLIIIPGKEVELIARYNQYALSPGWVKQMLGHLKQVLTAINGNSDALLADLKLLTRAEEAELLGQGSRPKALPPAEPIHALFKRTAAAFPERIAVKGETGSLTYGELNGLASCIAGGLRQLLPADTRPVAVLMPRSPEMVTALAAVIIAGMCYLPVDLSYPHERILYQLTDSKAKALVVSPEVKAQLREAFGAFSGLPVYDLAELQEAGAQDVPGASAGSPDDLLYIIYTSGSSGKPKGVPIRHRSFFNLLHAHYDLLGSSGYRRQSQVAGPGFDAMAFEIWPCLTSGGTLYIAGEKQKLDPPEMRKWLVANKINFSFLPTPIGESLLEMEWPEENIALDTLCLAGDRLTRYPAAGLPFKVFNLYGPTEDTVWSTYSALAPDPRPARLPDIGVPVYNHSVLVLNRWMQLQPPGLPGEICIAGAGLAEGYLYRPELTEQAFVDHPYEPGKKLYKTGDVGRWLPNGKLEFVGRKDRQVKVNGFRIELPEIEKAMLDLPFVREAVVLVKETAEGKNSLCAFYKATTNASVAALRSGLAALLPGFMIPQQFILVEKFPLTSNGKIDAAALAQRAAAPAKSTPGTGPHPGSKREESLIAVFREALQVEEVETSRNFFELGVNSLLLLQIKDKLYAALGQDVPLVAFFEYPTIASLAAHLGQQPGPKAENKTLEEKKGMLEESVRLFEM